MIEVRELTKVYGSRVAVWKVSFRAERGEILGFLGPNGAGKTTTMRMITGFVSPSSGTTVINGKDVAKEPLGAKAQIGYLCEVPPLYREMTVRSYLKFVTEIKRVPKSRRKESIDRAMELSGLVDVRDRITGHLSKGYRQRVGLAQAIIHEPAVLILDEPTVGLDPRQIIEIRDLIRRLGGEQTVILSTHILPEVTMTCNRVVIINEGQVVAEDTIEGLTAGLEDFETVRVRVARDTNGLTETLEAVDGVDRAIGVEKGVFDVRLRSGGIARERLAAAVVNSGAGLLGLARERASLEEIFLDLVTDEETVEEGA